MDQHLQSVVGKLASIWRYPVKSMLGEELAEIGVSESGLDGDRAFALIDCATGKVASAKNPRLWPNLFDHAAWFSSEGPHSDAHSELYIKLPNSERLDVNHAQLNERLSESVGRKVKLAGLPTGQAQSEGYWPDHDWLTHRGQVFEFALPSGTLFDCSPVHIVTSSTLATLQAIAPTSCFDVCRFRPNLVIEATGQSAGFIENDWINRLLNVGEVQLRITRASPRCVMTTLRQGVLPHDSDILRSAVHANGGNVGVYADVIRPGRMGVGDLVLLS
jgi:uncharacterized protein